VPDPTLHQSDSDGETPEKKDMSVDVRMAAMDLLARREHSLLELRDKLKRRFSDVSVIDDQLSRLAGENLLSDVRFAESYVRQRVEKGYGPLRLREELRARGVSGLDIDLALEALEIDWSQLASEVLRKKFGEDSPPDLSEKARRMRFMQYRGFAVEHYRQLARE